MAMERNIEWLAGNVQRTELERLFAQCRVDSLNSPSCRRLKIWALGDRATAALMVETGAGEAWLKDAAETLD